MAGRPAPLPTPAEMIANATTLVDQAYRALGDAAQELRSDWSTQPTAEQREQINRMREAIATAKSAINRERP